MRVMAHMAARSVLHSTVDQLLLEVSRESLNENNSTLSDNLLSALHSVFQQSLLHALDLVDKNHVMRFVCPTSGRELFQVKASTGSKVYTCLMPSSYCNCPSFVYSVILKEEAMLCKHLLAVRLCRAMGRVVQSQEVSGVDIADMLTADRDSLAIA